MTEEEMRKTWCPFVRTIPARRAKDGSVEFDGTAPAFNRYSTDEQGVVAFPDSCRCIASACSQWRWGHVHIDPNGQPRSTWPDLAMYGPATDLLVRHGFCGSAVKP